MFRKYLFLFSLITSVSFVYGDEWSLQTMMEVRSIEGIAISPDGSEVVYQIYSNNQPSLFLVNRTNSKLSQIAQNAISPVWSPDGTMLAYINHSSNQLETYSFKTKKREKITQLSGKITSPTWSPNSQALAFLLTPPADTDAITSTDEESKPFQQLWLISSDGKHIRRLTDNSFHVGSGIFLDHFAFSPNGQEIICPKMPSAEINRWSESELVKIDLATGGVSPFLPAAATEPHYSPDGKWVAYLVQNPSWAFIQDVWVVPAEGGEPRPLDHTYNRDIRKIGSFLGWSADSRYVYVIDYRGTQAEIYALPLSGKPAHILSFDLPYIHHAVLSDNHDFIACVGESSDQPQEVYIYDLANASMEKVSLINSKLPLENIAQTKHMQFKAKDGLLIDALLTYPLNYEKNTPFPLLLMIHGGPCYMFHDNFIGTPHVYPIATFASHGFGILRCNIRGSSGYGVAFRQANLADWGGEDFKDLMAAIDTLQQQKVIDPSHMGIMGWSYGGYMTAWAITQTNRFKAASVGAGLTNLISFSSTTDVPCFVSKSLGGELWNKYDLFLERSAITHIQNVNTPTLIQHGKEDKRVPPGQGIELYQALKKRGVPTKIMLFPHTEHSFKDPQLLFQAAEANLEWFEKYVLPDAK